MSDSKSSQPDQSGISRRSLVKGTTLAGMAAAIGGISLPFKSLRAENIPASAKVADEKIVWSACTVNCGSRCPLRMHVVDGEIRYVENGQYR